MHLEKPLLFPEKRGFLIAIGVLFVILSIHLWIRYQSYQAFISKPFYYTYAKVLSSYEKHKGSRHYQVLKLRSEEGFTFYTTSHDTSTFKQQRLRLQLFPHSSISFGEYLGTFYVKSRIKQQVPLPKTTKDRLLDAIERQHKDPQLSRFYQAIFFATPLDKSVREAVAHLGVSHLVALSGFHLGILWLLVYGLIHFFYRPLQQRFFPYRFALLDVGAMTLMLLGLYVWFVDSPPSLLRSYMMMGVGWFVLLLGIELLSFTFLAIVVFLLLALSPALLVSLGFWFSVAGVFYIFLLLRYTTHLSKWTITLCVIPCGMFILMLPITHTFFGVTTPYQLSSIALSLLFVPFYPLAILLHLFGIGDLLDSGLLWLLRRYPSTTEHLLPLWQLMLYLMLSYWAIWHKLGFGVVLGSAFGYMGYLYMM